MKDLAPSSVRGIAAVYALLFLVVIASGFGAYAAYNIPQVKHDVKVVKQSMGDQNLTRLADKYIGDRAALIGMGVVKITVLSVAVKGDSATVVARVTFTDGTHQVTQTVKVELHRGIWNPQSLASA